MKNLVKLVNIHDGEGKEHHNGDRLYIESQPRAEAGNLKYEYFFPMDDKETVLLIDNWEDQKALDAHHDSPMMGKIMELRDKYDLHMKVERFVSEESIPSKDRVFIKE